MQFDAVGFLESLFHPVTVDPLPVGNSPPVNAADKNEAAMVETPVVAFPVVDPFAGWIEYHRPDGGLVMVHPDYRDDCRTETEWRDEPTREVLKGGCPRCRSDKIIDVAIHFGLSMRRECGRCGRTVGFPVWQGKTTA